MSYKTFEDMKHDIPEGATHYQDESEGVYFAFFKCVDGVAYHIVPGLNYSWTKTRNKAEFTCDWVKKIPQNNQSQEWSGEGLPPVGSVVLGGFYHVRNAAEEWRIDYITESVGVYTVVETGEQYTFATRDVAFHKPETPQQRKERERLEAAYDLYIEYTDDEDCYSFPTFCKLTAKNKWLAIVDKTGYRKAK